MTIVEFTSLPTSAEGWCARLNNDDVSESDRAAFLSWVSASAENRAEYELAALAMSLSRGLKAKTASRGAPARAAPSPLARRFGSARKSAMTRRLAIAASIAIALLGSGWLAWHLTAPGYQTDIGEHKTVALEDGSTVELNTATAMNVDLSRDERHVTLRAGEAFFNIARDPKRPFVVKAANSEIHVLGTKFNVRIVGNEARVTVLEGHVRVEQTGAAGGLAASAAGAHPSSLELFPGQETKVTAEPAALRLSTVDTARQTAWREGKIYFDNEPLSSVLSEVNRYTPTHFVMLDATQASLKLSGVFRTGDVESVAFALRTAYALQTERRDDRILIR